MSFGNTVTFRKPVGITPRYPVKMVPNKCGCQQMEARAKEGKQYVD